MATSWNQASNFRLQPPNSRWRNRTTTHRGRIIKDNHNEGNVFTGIKRMANDISHFKHRDD
ncbi:hypothetical protein BAUCODRAFT_127500 [Baudoinia panamericana UAMH 10762]|uniref:Uncharacterized protein n=1 Tax=Baudoinia panamericana (strain UAMH 10762) TaxID=717646 RepID=M2MIF0_BAUPA|nr:uncharacterized protein BAUCODRAFT_127500 [Baudoinia panamericana UAMH 10762]EMC91043.1 hypothetical protein BAUCODRAFT_127500 [Baudoinia panamericana UAMH 10762]